MKKQKTKQATAKKDKQLLKRAEHLVKRRNRTLKFVKMIVENAYTFTGVNEMPLDDVGLCKVTGVNLDTREKSSNGSGKSRWWICLLRLFYGRKALGNEPVRAIYNTRTGNMRIEVWFERGGHLYVVREAKKHKDYPDGLHVTRDGKPWGAKNDQEALRKDLQGVLNRTYEEFIGTIIWKQNVDHVLVSGKPTERSVWISNFFGLNVYDEMFAIFAKKHEIAKRKLEALGDVRAESKHLKSRLDCFGDIEKTRKKIKRVRFKLQRCESKDESTKRELKALQTKIADSAVIVDLDNQLRKCNKSNKTLEQVNQELVDVQNNLDTTRSALKAVDSAKDVVVRYRRLSKASKSAEHDLMLLYQEVFKGDGNIPSTSDLKPVLVEAAEKAAVLQANLERATKSSAMNKKAVVAARKLDELGYLDCSAKYLRGLRKNHLAALAEFDKTVAKAETIADRNTLLETHTARCPTCGTKVDVETLKDEIDQANAVITKTKHNIKQYKKELAIYEEALILREQADRKIDGEEVDVEVIERKIKKLLFKTEALKKMIEFAETRETAQAKQKEMRKEYLEAKELETASPDALQDKVVKYEAQLEALQTLKNLLIRRSKHDTVHDTQALKTRQAELETHQASNRSKITKTSVTLDRLKTAYREHEETNEALKALSPKLRELKIAEKRERVYKALKKAYDKNGLKVRRLRELLAAIKSRLPVWTNILFTEKNMTIDTTGNEKKIGFEITQKTKTVAKNGKPKIEVKKFDASEASGSEKTRISCALMLTMADVASSEKQCNLLVLDELERGLDEPSRKIMSDEIIPLLKHKKPSLFLITHSLKVPREHVNSYMTITKKNQQSTTKFSLQP